MNTLSPAEPDEWIGWVELDRDLRGTGVDAQAYADRTGLLIIEDADAATVGAPCWYGIKADGPEADTEAVAAYVEGGGTATAVYTPGAAL